MNLYDIPQNLEKSQNVLTSAPLKEFLSLTSNNQAKLAEQPEIKEESKRDELPKNFVFRRGRNNRCYLNLFAGLDSKKRKAQDDLNEILGYKRGLQNIDFDESIVWNRRIMKRLQKESVL